MVQWRLESGWARHLFIFKDYSFCNSIDFWFKAKLRDDRLQQETDILFAKVKEVSSKSER